MKVTVSRRVVVWWHTLTSQEDGASLVEYVFLLMLVALVAFAAVEFFGTEVSAEFDSFNTEYGNAKSAAGDAAPAG